MFTRVEEAMEHFKFYSSGAMDDAAIHCIETKIAQFAAQTGRWSLGLAIAFNKKNWNTVSKICGRINKVHCDLTYQEKEDNHG